MPVRTAIVKKTGNQCEWGSGEKGTLLHSWWRRQYGDPSKKLRIELPYDPAILLLDIYPKDTKNTNSKRYTHCYVHCSIVYNSQDRQAT